LAITAAQFDTTMNLTARGVFLTARAFLPHLLTAGGGVAGAGGDQGKPAGRGATSGRVGGSRWHRGSVSGADLELPALGRRHLPAGLEGALVAGVRDPPPLRRTDVTVGIERRALEGVVEGWHEHLVVEVPDTSRG